MLGEEGRALLPHLRAYRHAVANHVQVIAGWLELGDVEQARAALEGLRSRLEAEARVAAALPEELAGQVLGLVLQSEAQGIEVCMEIEPPGGGGDRAAVPPPAPAVAAAGRALAAGWSRLQAALAGRPGVRGGRRLTVRWTGRVLELEAPGAGEAPVVIPLAGERPGGAEGGR